MLSSNSPATRSRTNACASPVTSRGPWVSRQYTPPTAIPASITSVPHAPSTTRNARKPRVMID